MKPAICGVCGLSALQSRQGDWVTFSNYPRQRTEDIGHPEGLEGFCAVHVAAARSLCDRTATDALSELRARYPRAPTL